MEFILISLISVVVFFATGCGGQSVKNGAAEKQQEGDRVGPILRSQMVLDRVAAFEVELENPTRKLLRIDLDLFESAYSINCLDQVGKTIPYVPPAALPPENFRRIAVIEPGEHISTTFSLPDMLYRFEDYYNQKVKVTFTYDAFAHEGPVEKFKISSDVIEIQIEEPMEDE